MNLSPLRIHPIENFRQEPFINMIKHVNANTKDMQVFHETHRGIFLCKRQGQSNINIKEYSEPWINMAYPSVYAGIKDNLVFSWLNQNNAIDIKDNLVNRELNIHVFCKHYKS